MIDLAEMHTLALTGSVVMLGVLLAIFVDLASGWQKAKERGEARTSYALSRTIKKISSYEGVLLIALIIDAFLHFGHLWELIHCDILQSVPAVTIVIGIFLCIVEIMSIRETADGKTRRHMEMIESIVSEKVLDRLTDSIMDKLDGKIKGTETEEEEDIN